MLSRVMATIARQVRDYIGGHPSISDALKMDIVNYSALARRICKELGIRREEAVLAACRRYPVEKLRGYSEDSIRRMLEKSRVETRTKGATVTVVQGVDVLQRLGGGGAERLDGNKRWCLLLIALRKLDA